MGVLGQNFKGGLFFMNSLKDIRLVSNLDTRDCDGTVVNTEGSRDMCQNVTISQ